ncbi:saccharopine dehydrogenase NADP-binding domain-containing protein [Mycobacterium sp. 48b]|uniref:saccharopine dehydrogenase NADP-binding domain-containing protein n=1 Tax=Mycobacterium sp. 48b TaxID=3400426 RepID=UPI003AAC57A3
MPDNRLTDVAVFGATGYTGKQIVRELLAAGCSVVCVGRDVDKLHKLAADVGQPVRVEAADLTERSRIEEICSDVRTVVNAAGSFVETCEPVARAAIATRTHYVDISGEQRSIQYVFDGLGAAAAGAGVALIPSAGFYAALADALVSLIAADTGRIDTVDIAYHITDWTPSGAAYANFLRGMGQPIVQFDHDYVEVRTPLLRTTEFPDPVGTRTVFTYPAPDAVTLPRHLDVGTLRTWMSASTFGSPVPDRFVPLMTRAVGAALRSPLRSLAETLFSATTRSTHTRIDDDPTRFWISVRVEGASGVRAATLSADGIFDLTAPIAASIVGTTLEDAFAVTGAVSPAQIIEPRAFLDGLAGHGLTYTLS